LFDTNCIELRSNKTGPFGFGITPTGYIKVESLRRGKNESVKRAFFIRRYDEDMDAFFRPILDQVQQRTGCDIRAVWEEAHNEKIDERILRLIRESSLVLLDIAPDRFNVGLEAGYALALRKPMIVIREKQSPWQAPPFDIATLNCFDYDRNDPDRLIKVLV